MGHSLAAIFPDVGYNTKAFCSEVQAPCCFANTVKQTGDEYRIFLFYSEKTLYVRTRDN